MINQFIIQAETHRQHGHWQDAVTAYDKALAIAPDRGDLQLARCHVLRRLGRLDEAVASIWAALGNGEQSPEVWIEAASALIGLNRLSEARATLHTALTRDAESARGWALLGETLGKQDKEQAAGFCFARSIALAPDEGKVRARMAQGLVKVARYDEALAELTVSCALAPESLDTIASLAQVLITLGRLDQAEVLLRQTVARAPDHLDARLGIARLHLLRGEFTEGWPAYEWRRKRSDLKLPKLSGPEWDGSSTAGKTIVVYPEQGFGDVIQFLRYIKPLAEQSGQVVLLVSKELEKLCQCMTKFADVRSSLKSLPDYDYHVPLLSLPRFMGTRTGADCPYLDVADQRGKRIPVPEGTDIKVGLVWAGRPTHANDRQRSARLETFMPLAAMPGVTFYTLQAGPRTSDIGQEAHAALFGDLSPHLKDFTDTASVIEQLDLVIAVDTSVAHLAGALNKPVWVLIPFAPDWRWLLGREDSPWYPTMRLFRQNSPTDWHSVIERVRGDLAALVERGRASRPQPNADRLAVAKAQFQDGLRAQSAGDTAKALSAYALSATYDRSNPDLYNNLGVALQRLGRLSGAEAAYQRAAALRPSDAGILSNLGSVLRERGELEESAVCHDQVVDLASNNARLLVNAAHAFLDLGDAEKALELIAKALALDPDNADAARDQAAGLLQKGEWVRGFAAYEAYVDRLDPQPSTTTMWDGGPLDGRSILIDCGRLVDDGVRFARFIADVAKRGAGEIIIRCVEELVPLMKMVPQASPVIAAADKAPSHDCGVRLISLPRLLGKTKDVRPLRTPYLKCQTLAGFDRHAGRRKVGLAWAPFATSTPVRGATAIPLLDLLPSLANPKLALYSLQRGAASLELKAVGADAMILDLGPRLTDLGTAAGLIGQMDLMLTTDVMLAQIAGALKIKTILLQGRARSWQWVEERGQAIWYPSVTLCRQARSGAWEDLPGLVGRMGSP